MKTTSLYLFALAALLALPQCTYVREPRHPQVSTTTTEQTTVNKPFSNTVETQTTRTY
jgi:hypothetical protein